MAATNLVLVIKYNFQSSVTLQSYFNVNYNFVNDTFKLYFIYYGR